MPYPAACFTLLDRRQATAAPLAARLFKVLARLNAHQPIFIPTSNHCEAHLLHVQRLACPSVDTTRESCVFQG